jgi:hypothetical protein
VILVKVLGILVKVLGILGGLFFCYCGVPTCIRTVRAGKSLGTPVDIAWMILLGSIAMWLYMTCQYGMDIILSINYGIEALSWGIITWYHYNS